MSDITVRAVCTIPNACSQSDLTLISEEEMAKHLIQSEGLTGIWDEDSFEIEKAWVEAK